MFFFFNDTATTEIYTLSLHDALPILKNPLLLPGSSQEDLVLALAALSDTVQSSGGEMPASWKPEDYDAFFALLQNYRDRKSTRLNSSHSQISYAVFCLKKINISPHAR